MDDNNNGTLERDLRLAYGAYAYLRAHDAGDVSATARLLREADLAYLAHRVVDETAELRGAVEGTHSHGPHPREDVLLEAYQSLYWLMVLAVAAGDGYDDLRPHEPLADPLCVEGTVHSWPLRALALGLPDDARRRRALRAGFAMVGWACLHAGIPAREPVRRDLRELRARVYLAPYWAGVDGPPPEAAG